MSGCSPASATAPSARGRLRGVRSASQCRVNRGIALTPVTMTGDAECFIALGFDAVESKPIQPARLITVIGEVLEAARHGAKAANRAA
jgi:CheY-like chemotaxis protein